MKNRYYSLVSNQDKTADLYIFGDIVEPWLTGLEEAWGEDYGDVSGLSIAKDLQEVNAELLRVHINSCGGYTSEGLAIYNVLKAHPAKVVTYCEGFACSAASLVFMAGEERVMRDASLLMIHNAWSSLAGNAAQMREYADTLEKISAAAAAAYREKITISDEELDKLLDGMSHEGTWITPAEAVGWGFATSIEEAPESAQANQSAMRTIMTAMTTKKLPAKCSVELDMGQANEELDKLSDRLAVLDVVADELLEKIDRLISMQGDPGVAPVNKATFFEKLKTAFTKGGPENEG